MGGDTSRSVRTWNSISDRPCPSAALLSSNRHNTKTRLRCTNRQKPVFAAQMLESPRRGRYISSLGRKPVVPGETKHMRSTNRQKRVCAAQMLESPRRGRYISSLGRKPVVPGETKHMRSTNRQKPVLVAQMLESPRRGRYISSLGRKPVVPGETKRRALAEGDTFMLAPQSATQATSTRESGPSRGVAVFSEA